MVNDLHTEACPVIITLGATTLRLTTLSIDLVWRALSPHLALNLPQLAPRRSRRALCLLGLLLALRCRLLLLAFFDCCLTSRGTSFGTLGSPFFDDVERSADDGSLVLYCAAGTLLGDFLFEVEIDVSTTSTSGTQSSHVFDHIAQQLMVGQAQNMSPNDAAFAIGQLIAEHLQTVYMNFLRATDLRDTLLMLPPEQCGPGDSSGVLSL